ncbi:hypothetical protein [Streptomyces sp. RG80]|uniref:hypothetical protein n=1 Tax=Streptomyces sp. RG80 TaxID=3157340 RepID=UPI00338F040E
MPLPVFHALDHVLVVDVDEVIDIANAEHIRTALVRRLLHARGQRADTVVVDLRHPCLEDAQALARAVTLRLLVVASHPLTRSVLRITAADRQLEVYPRLTAALRAVR